MYINCKYASRELIDILSSMSFADDYNGLNKPLCQVICHMT